MSTHGMELFKNNFEFLIGRDVVWKKEKNGKVPKNAIPVGGRTQKGDILYIGRAEYINSLTIGKVHPSHGCLYMPYGGTEVSLKEYEVLTEN